MIEKVYVTVWHSYKGNLVLLIENLNLVSIIHLWSMKKILDSSIIISWKMDHVQLIDNLQSLNFYRRLLLKVVLIFQGYSLRKMKLNVNN